MMAPIMSIPMCWCLRASQRVKPRCTSAGTLIGEKSRESNAVALSRRETPQTSMTRKIWREQTTLKTITIRTPLNRQGSIVSEVKPNQFRDAHRQISLANASILIVLDPRPKEKRQYLLRLNFLYKSCPAMLEPLSEGGLLCETGTTSQWGPVSPLAAAASQNRTVKPHIYGFDILNNRYAIRCFCRCHIFRFVAVAYQSME